MRYLVNQHTGELEGLPSIPIASSEEKDKVLQGNGSWGKKLQFDVVIQNGKYGYINGDNEFVSFMSQTDLSDATGTLSIENGGTGATTAAAARTNLGLATVASSGSYADLSNKPTIPSNTNQLVNGAGFTTATGHNHGLLHNDLTLTLANTSTDSGWSMINSSYNGFLLKTIRTNGSAPNWIENNYASALAFGGADTKGVLSVAYGSPAVKFAGGNGTAPKWWMRCTGTSGKTYDLNSPITGISRSGTTFTATRADGTTFTFTQQDNNTTYGNGNASTFGLTKLSDTYSGTANTSAKAANSIAASQWALQTAYANRNAADRSAIYESYDHSNSWSSSDKDNLSYVKIGKICFCIFHIVGASKDYQIRSNMPTAVHDQRIIMLLYKSGTTTSLGEFVTVEFYDTEVYLRYTSSKCTAGTDYDGYCWYMCT